MRKSPKSAARRWKTRAASSGRWTGRRNSGAAPRAPGFWGGSLTAAGLLVSKAGVSGAADKALMKQLSGYPQALGMSAGVMLVLAILPGIPMLPFLAPGGRRVS